MNLLSGNDDDKHNFLMGPQDFGVTLISIFFYFLFFGESRLRGQVLFVDEKLQISSNKRGYIITNGFKPNL